MQTRKAPVTPTFFPVFGWDRVVAPLALPVLAALPTEEAATWSPGLAQKEARLLAALRAEGRLLVAFSGGVDSSVVAAAALRALGPYDPTTRRGALAVLADSSTLARRELVLARAAADEIGIPLHEVQYSELDDAAWAANDKDRCYYCKRDLSQVLLSLAPDLGFAASDIAFGTTASDLGDHRPGLRAIDEAGARHPLVDAGLTKPEVRALARAWGLSVWDKPSTPCLASRVQYGEAIAGSTLARIEAAEDAVRALGFRTFRVRHHGTLARIEVPRADLERAFGLRTELAAALRPLGYAFVTLDLEGFRSGSMNAALAHD